VISVEIFSMISLKGPPASIDPSPINIALKGLSKD
jgi:hypothetical protein